MDDKKEITIYDIADRLNLSPATISRSLNNNPVVKSGTRERVLKEAKAMGYRSNPLAAGLRTNKTNTIGVIVPKLNSNFVSEVLSGIEKVINKAGYNLIISQSQENEKKERENAQTLFTNRVDGLIASLAFDTKNTDHFKPFFSNDIPVVFFDRVTDEKNGIQVVIDNFKAGYEATKHLIDQNCTQIAHITGNLSRNVYKDRLRGYKTALIEAGLEVDESNIYITNLDEESVTATAQKILEQPSVPDGIFITNDSSAAVCMKVFKDAGLQIPADIAIVGFNNDLISRIVEPTITTIDYRGQEMGEIVAQNIINLIEGTISRDITSTITINSQLIVRESSVRNI